MSTTEPVGAHKHHHRKRGQSLYSSCIQFIMGSIEKQGKESEGARWFGLADAQHRAQGIKVTA